MYITPCISVCKIDETTRVCKGCGRSIEQIKDWMKYTDDERYEIMKQLGYGKRKPRGVQTPLS